eukprot:TRINITY_DN95127_c0_g1_i1.p1 TRINITY_DN95127_c0_g1~~TRINITY_DN95127_c0_g1_i1.p1  ORF type:complete len:186 (+),score=7.40 TRINITY_DN95127_c0_g1_i1:142-699(+)
MPRTVHFGNDPVQTERMAFVADIQEITVEFPFHDDLPSIGPFYFTKQVDQDPRQEYHYGPAMNTGDTVSLGEIPEGCAIDVRVKHKVHGELLFTGRDDGTVCWTDLEDHPHHEQTTDRCKTSKIFSRMVDVYCSQPKKKLNVGIVLPVDGDIPKSGLVVGIFIPVGRGAASSDIPPGWDMGGAEA